MIQIAVIQKNNVTFPDLGKYAHCLLYQFNDYSTRQAIKQNINHYLWSMVQSSVTFVETPSECLLECICEQLVKPFDKNPETDFYYHCDKSYCFPQKCLELLHNQPLWADYPKNQLANINNLGCLFSLEHRWIENTCVVIGNEYHLTAPKCVKLTNIYQADILKVLRRRFYFSAILIGLTNCTKYYYQDPAILIQKLFNCQSTDSIQKLEITVWQYNLVFYFKKEAVAINPMATRINGLYPLTGEVLVIHQLEESIFANLSMTEIKKIDMLAYHLTNAVHSNDSSNTPYWNKYLMLQAAVNNQTNKHNQCTYCHRIMEQLPQLCNRCYRVKHCADCTEKFTKNHPVNCLSSF